MSKSKKVKFVYIRATEGASIRDSYYKANVDSSRKAGILVGSYHVYSSKTTAYQQFANFKAVAVKKKQDLVPVLDIEGHHSGRLNMKRVDKLLELMEREYGAKPMIYTSEKVYTEHFAIKKYNRYHIFAAKYEGRPVIRYTLWQHSKTGRIPGISGDVDLDKFHTSHSLYDIRIKKPKPAKESDKPLDGCRRRHNDEDRHLFRPKRGVIPPFQTRGSSAVTPFILLLLFLLSSFKRWTK